MYVVSALPGAGTALSGPEFTNQYFIYYVRKLPVWVKRQPSEDGGVKRDRLRLLDLEWPYPPFDPQIGRSARFREISTLAY